MASGGSKSAASVLLIVNLVLYFIATAIAVWAVNHGIQRSRETASALSISARLFPIYMPIGNTATGFFVIFSLIAGVVGMATSLAGLNDVAQWDAHNLHAAASSSLATWALTLLAMGLACKEIQLGWTDSNLRSLEIIIIVVSATQMSCMGAIQVGVEDAVAQQRGRP
ncbi:membrane protein PM19L-like [Juglans microcarpa x Juglans regia]|uniref:membrane protein PM19L-like n=1 Tax=Juglans microcarpa x Juglans regia TaxID=2249226 RepID=UPI001B7DD648|nr:membrane protein PM19L-like [Juglans microcarpa x Juglans regia]